LKKHLNSPLFSFFLNFSSIMFIFFVFFFVVLNKKGANNNNNRQNANSNIKVKEKN
jgi:hypothetical protein